MTPWVAPTSSPKLRCVCLRPLAVRPRLPCLRLWLRRGWRKVREIATTRLESRFSARDVFFFPPGAGAASAASCASEAMETLGRQDGGGRGRQGKGGGNGVALRSCGSLPARVLVVVCPRLPVFVCGCAGARERLARSLSRARKAAQHETRFPFLINASFGIQLLFRTRV